MRTDDIVGQGGYGGALQGSSLTLSAIKNQWREGGLIPPPPPPPLCVHASISERYRSVMRAEKREEAAESRSCCYSLLPAFPFPRQRYFRYPRLRGMRLRLNLSPLCP